MILHSPAKAEHIRVTGRFYKMLDMHVAKHNLGEVFFEKALVHLTRNDYEPDVLFYSNRSRICMIVADRSADQLLG